MIPLDICPGCNSKMTGFFENKETKQKAFQCSKNCKFKYIVSFYIDNSYIASVITDKYSIFINQNILNVFALPTYARVLSNFKVDPNNLDFSNLNSLENKINTWILFS